MTDQEPVPTDNNRAPSLPEADRAVYERFEQLIDEHEPFTPLDDQAVHAQADAFGAARHSNELSGNPATPLTDAVLDLFVHHRVPPDISRQIVVTYFTTHHHD